MSTDISIKNGANLNLKGLASMDLEVAKKSLNYALNPDDFFGLIPPHVGLLAVHTSFGKN